MSKFDINKYRQNIGKLYKIKGGQKHRFITPTGNTDDLFVILRVVFDPEVGDTASYGLALPHDMREECFWDCRRFHEHYEEIA
jgi:hypothetical protein